MREHAESIASHNVRIVAIAPADSEQIRYFLDVYGPYPFPVLGDPHQIAYSDLGHLQMSKWDSFKLVAGGLMSGKFKVRQILPKDPRQKEVFKRAIRTQDVYQQGGTWLFSGSGEVLWKHIDTSPEDHASIEQILEEIANQ